MGYTPGILPKFKEFPTDVARVKGLLNLEAFASLSLSLPFSLGSEDPL